MLSGSISKSIIKSKFATDSLFSLVSVVLLGVCGLVLNFVIARKYNAATLGVFNEVYACYILFSQFAALGVQVSSLKHTAEYSEDPVECGKIFTSAFIVVVLSASVFSAALFFLRSWIAVFFKSPGVATGLLWIIPGLWCFSMNKLFLNVLNGFRMMKAYAFFTSIRYIAMLLALAASVRTGLAGERLSIIFSVSESLLFVLLFVYRVRSFSFSSLTETRQWMKRHLSFGLRSMVGGISADLNTRIDVIILGYFSSDRIVGIYSFAATIVEGVAQIPYVLKQNVDPILARLIMLKKTEEVVSMISRGKKWSFGGMLVLGIVLISIYPYAISLVTGNPDFKGSWPVFCILMAGSIIQSGYVPFSGILVQSGYPFLQTLHLLSFTLSNVVFNIVLVPFFGIFGAAIATSLAFVMFVYYLKLFTFRAMKIMI
jgi:O-antigen/teichoic acid export membrane protein